MIWYEYLAVTGAAMFGILAAVLLGGWLVFKAKTITMQTPFLGPIKKDKSPPVSYAADLYRDEDLSPLDDVLSPAAARLRAQKDRPEEVKRSVLAAVRGK